MRLRIHLAGLLGAVAGLAALWACRHAQATLPGGAPGTTARAPAALAVRRGDLQPRLLLTGELEAAEATALVTPSSPAFQLQLTWLAEDGSTVGPGQPVAQFDNSSFVSQIEEKRSAVTAAEAELARLAAAGLANEADKGFAVEQKQRDLAKARTAASVPPDLISAYDYQDHQLKLRSAEAELAKAERDLAKEHAAGADDVAVQRLVLAKARRELAAAESGIRDLTLRAPHAGTVQIADHPWEGRKIQVSDNLWPGMTVATLPDLSTMVVEASLSDVDDGQVAAGMSATCFVDAFPNAPLAGRVTEVTAVARESGRSALLRYFPVRIELAPLPAAERARLRPGMSVRVEVAAPARRGVLLVPRVALDLAASPPRALLAGGGTAAVRLGAGDAFQCAAETGVAAGQLLRQDGGDGRDGRDGQDGGRGGANGG
jgi:multidrug resistance efflux pump